MQLPSHLTEETLGDVLAQVWSHRESDHILLDFSHLRFASASAALALALALRRFPGNAAGHTGAIEARGVRPHSETSATSYLKHVGFFDLAGLTLGKGVGEARATSAHVPFRKISKDEFASAADPVYRPLRTLVDERASELAVVLIGNELGDQAKRMATYVIREVVRNVFDHARVNDCYITGQRFADGSVEIGVGDLGIGVHTSIRRRFPNVSDTEALHHAIRPGVSTSEPSGRLDNENAGFGLFVLSELGRLGRFDLASGTAVLTVDRRGEVAQDTRFPGTYVCLNFRPDPEQDFAALFREIVYRGEVEAYQMGLGSPSSLDSKKA